MATESLTLRIDADLKRWLERKAETEKRSVSKQTEVMLTEIREREPATSKRR